MKSKTVAGIVNNLNKRTIKGMRFSMKRDGRIFCILKINRHTIKICTYIYEDYLLYTRYRKNQNEFICNWIFNCTKMYNTLHDYPLMYDIEIETLDDAKFAITSFFDRNLNYNVYDILNVTIMQNNIHSINSICKSFIHDAHSIVYSTDNKCFTLPENTSVRISSSSKFDISIGNIHFLCTRDMAYVEGYYQEFIAIIVDYVDEVRKIHELIKRSTIRGFIVGFNNMYKNEGIVCSLHRYTLEFSNTPFTNACIQNGNIHTIRRNIATGSKNLGKLLQSIHKLKIYSVESKILSGACNSVICKLLSDRLSLKTIHITPVVLDKSYAINNISYNTLTNAYDVELRGLAFYEEGLCVPTCIANILEKDILNVTKYIYTESGDTPLIVNSFLHNNNLYKIFSVKLDGKCEPSIIKIFVDGKHKEITDELLNICRVFDMT